MAAVPITLLSTYLILDQVSKEDLSKKSLFFYFCCCVTSAAIGVGLAVAAIAIFPGAMLRAGSAALTGAAIGGIAPISSPFAIHKVDDYIISPIIEYFSSKEQKTSVN